MEYIHQTRATLITRMYGSANHLVLLCTGGRGWIRYGTNERMIISKHTVIMIQPHIPFSYGSDPHDPWSFYYLHVDGEHVQNYFDNRPLIQFLTLTENYQLCLDLFAAANKQLQTEKSLNSLIYSSHLIGQLLTLITFYQGQLPAAVDNNDPIRLAIRYMYQHLDARINLHDLCQVANVSKPYLIKLFKRETGYSPIDYYLRLKIKAACDCLEFTNLSVKEICYKFAFADQYYFSRMFSKVMGQSPTIFRRERMQ